VLSRGTSNGLTAIALAPYLQDAIKCDWEEFIKSMPHLETKIQDDNSYAQGRLVFRMKPLVPVHDRKMFILSFTVKSRQDLWRVCHKAPSAVLEFPDLEFEIGADARRKIDSLYNHIAAAVYNLSMHVSTMGSQISQGHKDAFSEVQMLTFQPVCTGAEPQQDLSIFK
jgi:hypothetical protein